MIYKIKRNKTVSRSTSNRRIPNSHRWFYFLFESKHAVCDATYRKARNLLPVTTRFLKWMKDQPEYLDTGGRVLLHWILKLMYYSVAYSFLDHLSDYRLLKIYCRSSCERTKRRSGWSDNAECPVFQNCVSKYIYIYIYIYICVCVCVCVCVCICMRVRINIYIHTYRLT